MEIDGINPLDGLNQPEQTPIAEDTSSTEVKQEQTPVQDTVEVTGGDISRFSAQLDEVPEVREDSVEALKEQIAEGSYQVPSEDVASKVLEELL